MRKLILLILLGLFFVSVVGAEECNVARPYFGSVNCLESEWSSDIEVYDGQEWSCDTENCEIRDITPTDVDCTGAGTTSRLRVSNQYGTKIIDCDSTIHPLGDECASAISINKDLRRGDKIFIDFSCNLWAEPEGNPSLLVKYKKLELFKNIDSASNIPISNTEFCNFNSQWDGYSKQLSDNEILNSVTLSTDSEL